jgi:mevalonate kinase
LILNYYLIRIKIFKNINQNAIALSVDLKTNVQIRLNKEGNDVKLLLNNFDASTFWTINSLSAIKLIEEEQKLNKVLDFSDQLIEKLPKCETSDSLTIDVINSFNAFLLLYIGISDSYCSSTRISMEVTVSTSLPCGAGLGSSSSYIVSLTAALLRAYNLSPEPKLISEWSFQIDKLFHGRPSGIDNSICTFGGALLFRNGKIEEQIQNVEPLPVILVNTKVARNTKALVEKVRQRYQKFPTIIDNIMSAIDQISLNAWQLVKKCSDFESFAVSITKFIYNLHKYLQF